MARETHISKALQAVNSILYTAAKDHYTEVLIKPGETDTSIKYGGEGRKRKLEKLPVKLHTALVARLRRMAELNSSGKTQEVGSFSVSVHNVVLSVSLELSSSSHGKIARLSFAQP